MESFCSSGMSSCSSLKAPHSGESMILKVKHLRWMDRGLDRPTLWLQTPRMVLCPPTNKWLETRISKAGGVFNKAPREKTFCQALVTCPKYLFFLNVHACHSCPFSCNWIMHFESLTGELKVSFTWREWEKEEWERRVEKEGIGRPARENH